MADEQIRFEDGRGYEQFMGRWSQLVGEPFLHWLNAAAGRRWLDIGCGNGAFTQLIVERCAPASVDGIDPSDAQLEFARARMTAPNVTFHRGDAMALPFADDTVDVAVMPLVIFFVPEPARGVSEMARVVRQGGIVSAYAWDIEGGGLPFDTLREEMRARQINVPMPPSPQASRLDVLRQLWEAAGLSDVDTTAITVERSFASFDDYWRTVLTGPSVAGPLKALSGADASSLQARVRELLPTAADGSITCSARANAIRGNVSV